MSVQSVKIDDPLSNGDDIAPISQRHEFKADYQLQFSFAPAGAAVELSVSTGQTLIFKGVVLEDESDGENVFMAADKADSVENRRALTLARKQIIPGGELTIYHDERKLTASILRLGPVAVIINTYLRFSDFSTSKLKNSSSMKALQEDCRMLYLELYGI